MSQNSSPESKGPEDVNINELIKPYKKIWPWFILSVISFLILAFIFVKITTPVYQIQSSVLIKDAKKPMPGNLSMISDISGLGNMATNSIENEMEVFRSKRLMTEVVTLLGLQTSLYAEKNFKKTELYGENSPILIQVITEKDYEDPIEYPVKISLSGDKVELSSPEIPKNIVT